MRNKFDRQLSQLNAELITMGSLCEEAITNAVKYLVDGDEKGKNDCLLADRQIDQKERDIENLCLKLILQQQPVAGDLRTVSAALKMISDMERIGDQAADIVEIVPYVAGSGLESETHIKDMADAAIQMVSESVESFVKLDMDAARRVMEHDDLVDDLFDKVKQELIKSITGSHDTASHDSISSHDSSNSHDTTSHDTTEALIDMVMIAKYLERIGDHAENIAEWVIYSITGEHIS